jgi:hypothetical protein
MKSKKAALMLTSLAAALAVQVAEAQNSRAPANPPRAPAVSYTHVGVRYMFQDLDQFSCDQDGFNLYGSLDIQHGWFAKASYTDVSGSRGCGSSSVTAGGGYHMRFDSRMDLYATVSFESISPDGSGSDSGLVLTGGARGFLTPELEAGLELYHSTTFDGNTAINGFLGYWITPEIAITGDLGLGSDVKTLAIGARLNF